MLVDMKLCDSVQFEVGTPHLNRGLEGAKVLSSSFTLQRAPQRFCLCPNHAIRHLQTLPKSVRCRRRSAKSMVLVADRRVGRGRPRGSDGPGEVRLAGAGGGQVADGWGRVR